jgi:hypothetical protein
LSQREQELDAEIKEMRQTLAQAWQAFESDED